MPIQNCNGFQQPIDFRDESDALYDLLKPLSDADFERKSQFKDWSIHDVISHLHAWNYAADLSLSDPEKFTTLRDGWIADMGADPLTRLEAAVYHRHAGRWRARPCTGEPQSGRLRPDCVRRDRFDSITAWPL